MILVSSWMWPVGAERGRYGPNSITLLLCEQVGALLFILSSCSCTSKLRRREIVSAWHEGDYYNKKNHLNACQEFKSSWPSMHYFRFSSDLSWEENPCLTYWVLLGSKIPEAERCMACHRCPTHSCLRAAVSAAYTDVHAHTRKAVFPSHQRTCLTLTLTLI